MANDERKPATSSLIPLEIDPASILSLSKGVIFDTIVHNIEYTLNNQRPDPLPWKLIGMSLICDPSRNKRYMQKLQKMQCVPSVISTQIYHSKLIKADAGILATPGKKIILATAPRRRLTGIIVCRSVDELLYMESSNTENVHFIQYKLLSYERIATRELVNGPKLSSIRGKVIKTVFDFELTQNNGFPRQLLPVAIISFGRQDGCDLVLSIRNFLKLDEHKTFDKSYLVTSINVDLDRLREEQERREEEEFENEIAMEKLQRRQPLADLSRKTIDTGNAVPAPPSQSALRVPPLKIKIPRSDKPAKAPAMSPPLDMKYRCLLKLDRIDLSMYNISNLPTTPPIIPAKNPMEYPVLSNLVNKKTKPVTITKPYEHSKPLKRLNNVEVNKQSTSISSQFSKQKPSKNSSSISSAGNDLPTRLPENKDKGTSTSASTMSPIYRPRPSQKKPEVKKSETKKVQRPVLPPAYHCSLVLTPIDLSMYDIDLPPMITVGNRTPMDVESTTKSSSPCNSLLSDANNGSEEPEQNSDGVQSTESAMELETISEQTEENIVQIQPSSETNTYQILPPIVDEVGTPDLNGPDSNIDQEFLPLPIDEPLLIVADESESFSSMDETVSELINEMITQASNQVETSLSNEESMRISSPTSSSPERFTFSPDLPPLDDDPVLFSLENPQVPISDHLNIMPQDYIIIVPCSDEEDDLDDYSINDSTNAILQKDIDSKNMEISSPPQQNILCSTLINPSLARVLDSSSRLNSPRLSSSSSCSSISTSILLNQSPRPPLFLTHVYLSQKILQKKQRKSIEPIVFSHYDLNIPINASEPLIDPRLKYRLQPITTEPDSIICCNQCSISPHLPPIFASSTQTILFDRRHPLDFVDPRRESLKTAILYHIYQRIKLLIPNIFIINSNQFQKFLFEQTIFKSNCSLHLEYLLHKLKRADETTFFHMIKSNEDFQLAPLVNQLISHS